MGLMDNGIKQIMPAPADAWEHIIADDPEEQGFTDDYWRVVALALMDDDRVVPLSMDGLGSIEPVSGEIIYSETYPGGEHHGKE